MELRHWPEIKLSSLVVRPACVEDQKLTSVDRQMQKHGKISWNSVREVGIMLSSLSLCTLACWLLPSGLKAPHAVFSVFFLLVFIIALRTHKASAYGAGIFAACAYGGLFSVQSNAITLYSLIEPFLLLFVAVITHDLLQAQQERLRTTRQQCAQLEELLQDTTQRYGQALEMNRLLEKQYAPQEGSAEAPREISTLVLKDGCCKQYVALLDIISLATGAWSCALYLSTNQGDGPLRLLASRAPQDASYPTYLKRSDPLIDKVLQRLDVCTIRDLLLEGQASSRCKAVMAGPLLGKNKQLLGVIVIEALPLTRLTSATIEQLSAILTRMPLLLAPPYASGSLILDDDEETEHTLPAVAKPAAAAIQPLM